MFFRLQLPSFHMCRFLQCYCHLLSRSFSIMLFTVKCTSRWICPGSLTYAVKYIKFPPLISKTLQRTYQRKPLKHLEMNINYWTIWICWLKARLLNEPEDHVYVKQFNLLAYFRGMAYYISLKHTHTHILMPLQRWLKVRVAMSKDFSLKTGFWVFGDLYLLVEGWTFICMRVKAQYDLFMNWFLSTILNVVYV